MEEFDLDDDPLDYGERLPSPTEEFSAWSVGGYVQGIGNMARGSRGDRRRRRWVRLVFLFVFAPSIPIIAVLLIANLLRTVF